MADIAITAANFKPSNLAYSLRGTAAGAITRGRAVIFSTSLAGFIVAPANALGGAKVAGFAMEDASTGQDFLYVVKDPALNIGGVVAPGDTVWVSATGLTKTFADLVTGWAIVVAGVCTVANVINLDMVQGGSIP